MIRRLTLVRHAKSSWDYAELSDFERPLNTRGRRDAPAMARRLAPELERPLRLVSSPALRAITTAHAFAEALGVAHTAIRVEPRIYDATRGTLFGLVQELDDVDTHVLLFGHNPGFSELAQLLAPCSFGEMPTCAVATLAFELAHWRELQPHAGTLLRYDYPKKAE
ncbi:MAG TPA: histidine phosphatase family protein [Nevskia sp.]|nr:histidine phosphatase family protein [Nevskia sp.]